MRKKSLLPTIAIAYFMIGFVFSIFFAIYYHWPLISFLSPGFYIVILTWPVQTIGFTLDILKFGLVGKPLV